MSTIANINGVAIADISNINGVAKANATSMFGADIPAGVVNAYSVSGCGNADLNGTYTSAGASNGRTYYDFGSNRIYWDGAQYNIHSALIASDQWTTNNAPASPDLGVWVAVDRNGGTLPAPTVTAA